MGSKRSMLESGLGQVLSDHAPSANRFVDLFAGSAAVSWHVAERHRVPVFAVDTQEYSRVLAGAVVSRTEAPSNPGRMWDRWVRDASEWIAKSEGAWLSFAYQAMDWDSRTKGFVADVRKHCRTLGGPITRAYGGHYFSPAQAIILDGLRATIPGEASCPEIYLAALVIAASECVAAPGHTAQPFQPTSTAAPFLFEAWRRDIWGHARRAFLDLSTRHARSKGSAAVSDALIVAKKLEERDVVFIDPPYSGVQYSRFYHVLETLARGSEVTPEGTGRYPSFQERPHSHFSLKSKSQSAFESLARVVAIQGSTCIVTYPSGECSNGLSGDMVIDTLTGLFQVQRIANSSTFSTLGGNGTQRAARLRVDELILVCTPR
ncbi:MAG: DNA adenine methylase [Armatimonadetes bacterium]|nr:DNA adenine methylase [Armatimonadota bacterium]